MKRFTAVILALLTMFTVIAFSSCASNGTIKSDTLTIGVDDTYPPMEYRDKSSNLIGFDVDMATEIGKRINKKIEWKPTSFDGIFSALASRKFDCIISSISITAARQKTLELTKPYVANAQMIVVKPDDNSITSDKSLAGKTVAVQSGTTAKDSADTLNKNGIKFTLKSYDQIIETFTDLKLGRVNAVIVDEVVGEYYIAQDPTSYKAAAVKLTNEPIGVAFKKGNTALRDTVQKALDAMVADGTMKKISEKWFGKDLTSDIDTKYKTLS